MVAFYDMMKKTIVMPAHLMEDGKHVRAFPDPCPPPLALLRQPHDPARLVWLTRLQRQELPSHLHIQHPYLYIRTCSRWLCVLAACT